MRGLGVLVGRLGGGLGRWSFDLCRQFFNYSIERVTLPGGQKRNSLKFTCNLIFKTP